MPWHRIKRYPRNKTGHRLRNAVIRHRRALLVRAAYGAAGGLGNGCVALIVFLMERHL